LYALFYTIDYQITHYGYSYVIYSQDTGSVKDEQMIELPLGDDYAQELSNIVTGLRPGTRYAFCVYAKNGVGITYRGYRTVKIPVE
jgi:Fibronectin type III domain.